MIRALATAADGIGHYLDKQRPAVVVRRHDAWSWYVAVERTEQDGTRTVVCKATERTCARALLACALALLIARQRTSRIDVPTLGSAVRRALS